IESILIANLAASATSLLLLLPSAAGQIGGGVDRAVWKQLLVFGLPFVPGGLGYALVERLNIFFLERIPPERVIELYGADVGGADLAARAAELGPYVYTEYVVGAYGGIIKLAVLMALVVQMFRYAWQPFFLQHQNDEDARPLFARVFSLLTLALLTVFLGVSFFAAEIVSFPIPGVGPLIQPRYWLGLPVIPVVLAGFVFQGWYYHISAAAYLSNTTKYFVHATMTGSAAALLLNVLFVPRLGMMAAAAATAVSYAVMTITLYALTRRAYAMPIRFGRVAAAVAAACAVFAVWSVFPTVRTLWAETLLIAGFVVVSARILDVRIGSAVRLLLPGGRDGPP
ncbi:MAG: polysaccharide biosynthesis protein, partial [Rhodothermales bacterium]|nr:polysaccharide biosynthesis protein [Rhodothermales bacterium]